MDLLPDTLVYDIFLRVVLPADYISEVIVTLSNIYLVCKPWADALDSPRSLHFYHLLFANFCLKYTCFTSGKPARKLLTESGKIPCPRKDFTDIATDLIWFNKIIRVTSTMIRIYAFRSRSLIREMKARYASVHGRYLHIREDDKRTIYADGNVNEPYFIYSSKHDGHIMGESAGLSLVTHNGVAVHEIICVNGQIVERYKPEVYPIAAIFPDGILYQRRLDNGDTEFMFFDLQNRVSREAYHIKNLASGVFTYKDVGFGITDDYHLIGFRMNPDKIIWSHQIEIEIESASIYNIGLGYGFLVETSYDYRWGMIFEIMTGTIVKRLGHDEVSKMVSNLDHLKLVLSDDFGYDLVYH